jgi:hypothetical protein
LAGAPRMARCEQKVCRNLCRLRDSGSPARRQAVCSPGLAASRRLPASRPLARGGACRGGAATWASASVSREVSGNPARPLPPLGSATSTLPTRSAQRAPHQRANISSVPGRQVLHVVRPASPPSSTATCRPLDPRVWLHPTSALPFFEVIEAPLVGIMVSLAARFFGAFTISSHSLRRPQHRRELGEHAGDFVLGAAFPARCFLTRCIVQLLRSRSSRKLSEDRD